MSNLGLGIAQAGATMTAAQQRLAMLGAENRELARRLASIHILADHSTAPVSERMDNIARLTECAAAREFHSHTPNEASQ